MTQESRENVPESFLEATGAHKDITIRFPCEMSRDVFMDWLAYQWSRKDLTDFVACTKGEIKDLVMQGLVYDDEDVTVTMKSI